MESLKINIKDLKTNHKSIYKYSLPKVKIEATKSFSILSEDSPKELTICVIATGNKYDKKDYPIVEYISDDLYLLASNIAYRIQTILGRNVTCIKNTQCDWDLTLTLYRANTLHDLQKAMLQMEQEVPNLQDVLVDLEVLEVDAHLARHEGNEGNEGNEGSAHLAGNKPNKHIKQNEGLCTHCPSEPKEPQEESNHQCIDPLEPPDKLEPQEVLNIDVTQN